MALQRGTRLGPYQIESPIGAGGPASVRGCQGSPRTPARSRRSQVEDTPVIGKTLGPYRVLEKIGEGGMGEVYKATDTRLERTVAIKVLPAHVASDPDLKRRFEREAKTISSLNHPNICTLHDVGQEGDVDFLVMEYLEGETLAQRLEHGALPVGEAVQQALVILSALEAVHRRGLLHRDLKPANLFLTSHGLKLLDFGLARWTTSGLSATTAQLTQAGMVIGTPQYLAPESLHGQPVDARADLFAVGTLLYEMITGQPPFKADSLAALVHAVTHGRPPALTGSTAIAALDRVIHRAMAKRPDDRYPSADAMSQDLRNVLARSPESGETPQVRSVTRLIVLPLRVLRPDPETDFLAFSLPDAIASSLSGLDSLVVRSSVVAAKFSVEAPDLAEIAAQADVDIVVVGTLLRSGQGLRISLQLLEAPGGTVLWSQQTQVSLGDLFQLQDEVAQRIVESLASPLMGQELAQTRRDTPATARAYEYYLRGNQLSAKGPMSRPDATEWELARDFYRRCVEEDPAFAPAWAQLGQVYRLTEKYFPTEAREHLTDADAAFQRALGLNPDLPMAHKLYAYLEVEQGRATDAMRRLIEQAKKRQADPELFAGLVHACRYCGLLEASVAAHEHAQRLDPKMSTSVIHTYWHLGEYGRVADTEFARNPVMVAMARLMLNRTADAMDALAALQKTTGRMRHFFTAVRAAAQGQRDETVAAIDRVAVGFHDPEALFYLTRLSAHVGDAEGALALFDRAVAGGFCCYPSFARDSWLDGLRAHAEFRRVLSLAEAQHREAIVAFCVFR